MEEIKIEKNNDSTEDRKVLHELVDNLTDLADGGSNPAAALLIDFGEYGTIVVATRGLIALDQIMAMNERECDDQECEAHSHEER